MWCSFIPTGKLGRPSFLHVCTAQPKCISPLPGLQLQQNITFLSAFYKENKPQLYKVLVVCVQVENLVHVLPAAEHGEFISKHAWHQPRRAETEEMGSCCCT